MTLIAENRASSGGSWASASGLLRTGLASLDITLTERNLAVGRYLALGEVLDEFWLSTRGENRIFTQGSFRLGTVTRRVNGDVDVDIDCVALRDIERSSITQEELKQEVGRAVREYARRPSSGRPTVTESDRCWTLSWPGMHMDVLPAIPASDHSEGLLIPDKTVRAWQRSNPDGYAAWFSSRMAVEFRDQEVRLAKELEVEDVPEWQVKTSLQRSIQALKRHRDLYFRERPDHRPSSIVITTLAAMSYAGAGDLLDVLRDITKQMALHISYEDGRWHLPNPIEPDENFTDYWAVDPELPKNFFEWLERAQRDFGGLDNVAGLDVMARQLENAFGPSVSSAAMADVGQTLGSARSRGAVAIVTGSGAVTFGASNTGGGAARAAKPNNFYGGRAR